MAKKKRKNRQGMPVLNIMAGAPEEFMGMFMEFLVESYILADEPEFIDLYFDEEQAYASAEITHKKYKNKLQKAEKKGGEELEFLRDDMRVEAIDRLLSDPVRKDILNRLNRLVERLDISKSDVDSEKFVMAIAVKTAFDTSKLPWGMINLVTEIFQRSLGITVGDEEEVQLLDELQDLIGEELTPERFFEQIEDPAFIQKLENTIDTDSDLYKRLSAQAEKSTQEFYDALWHGRVELDIFTEDEVLEYFETLRERFEAAGIDPENIDTADAGEILKSAIDENLAEIVTAKRLRQIRKELRKISDEWLRTGDKHAGALRIELEHLKNTELSNNKFFLGILFSSSNKACNT